MKSLRLLPIKRALVIALASGLIASARGQSQWTVVPSGTTSSLNAIAFGKGLFVAVGDNGTILTSADGNVWTPRTSGTTDRLLAIALGNGRFVATRANRASPAITSSDGINWTPVSLTDANGQPASSGASDAIVFGGGRFLALGSGAFSHSTEIMASADGISFQTVNYARYPAPDYLSEALKSVIYFRGQYYASTPDQGFLVSPDAISWKQAGITIGMIAATDELSNMAVLGSHQAFSIDAAHTFLRTEQPIDHSEVFPGPSTYLPEFTAMCYGAGSFVAMDTKGRTWTSERGEFWTPKGHCAKAEEGFRGVTFDGLGHFVAVGSAPASGLALIALSQADPPRANPPGYTVYSLKDVSNGVFDGDARAVNNSGVIAGSVVGPSKNTVAAIFRDGKVTTFPGPLSGASTRATAVNDAGMGAAEVVGQDMPSLGFALPSQARTFPGGAVNSTAPSINSSGSIVGRYQNFDGTGRGIYQYDTTTGQTTDLGNLGLGKIDATAINDRGDMAGSYVFETVNGNDHQRPFRLSAEGQLTLIPTLGGTFIWNPLINSSGDVVGSSTLAAAPTSLFETHVFLFHDGVLSDIDVLNTRDSVAAAMNGHGDVVGYYYSPNLAAWQSTIGNAFLYHDGAMYDLNWLLDESGDGWLLHFANGINDNGWIVGQGWRHGDHLEPFLAIPNGAKPAGVQTRFVNVSTRLRTGVGDDALIAGFILRGGLKHVILRAMGPGLRNFGNPSASLPNLLADPTLELFNERGERVAFNDNFSDLPYFPDQNEIGIYGLAPPYGGAVTADSVIAVTLPEGSYTAVVRGKDGTSGNCLVEVYNVDIDYSPALLNISTRGPVGSGDDVMIAGFVIQGNRERRVLVRGLGPSLAAAGVANPLLDPMLEIHDQNGQIAANDDWRSDQETDIAAAGLAPGDDRDAAVILSLWPGSYTAIVRGKANSTGNALVEVFALP